MEDEHRPVIPDGTAVQVSPRARRFIAAVLSVADEEARAIRARATRQRPRTQIGPSADYGDEVR